MTSVHFNPAVATPKAFVQAVQAQTQTHGVLWHIANIIFLGFPSLCEEIGEVWGRGRTTKEVTLHQPVSMGTEAEREVEAKLSEKDVYSGVKEFFSQGANLQGERGFLERFTVEIKSKLEGLTQKEVFDLWTSMNEEVKNRRIQLVALAPNHKQRFEARVRLQLALLRLEGVRIALSAIGAERRQLAEAASQAKEVNALQNQLDALLSRQSSQSTREKCSTAVEQIESAKAHLKQVQNDGKAAFMARTLQVTRQVHEALLKITRQWSLEQATERTRLLAELCWDRP